MRRTFLVTLLVNIAGPAAGLLTGPLLARALGPEGRGDLAALLAPILMLGIICTFGAQDALAQRLATETISPSKAIYLAMRVWPAQAVVCFVAYITWIKAFGPDTNLALLLTLAVAAALGVALNLLQGIANGQGNYKALNLMKLSQAIPRIAAISILFIFGFLTVGSAATVQAALVFVALLFCVPIVRRWTRLGGVHQNGSRGTESSLGTLRFSLALWPGLLAMVAISKLDQAIGLPLIGSRALGLYAASVSLAELPLAVASAARIFILGKAVADQNRVARVTLTATVALCGGLAVISHWLVPALLGDDFSAAVAPTIVLCAGTVAFCLLNISGAALIRAGHAWKQSIVLVGCCLLNILLLILLKEHGALGAALASTIAYLVGAIWLLVMAVRVSPLDFRVLIPDPRVFMMMLRR